MSHSLSLLLLIVGFISTAVAFGGETWKKGDTPLINRITWRGWVSSACLIIALIFGIWKEYDAERDEGAAKVAQGMKDQAAKQDKDNLDTQLSESQKETKVLEKALDNANASLDFLRGGLRRAQTNLDRQSVANLETALADSGAKISSIKFLLPLNNEDWPTNFGEALYSPLLRESCKRSLDMLVNVNEGSRDMTRGEEEPLQIFQISADDMKRSYDARGEIHNELSVIRLARPYVTSRWLPLGDGNDKADVALVMEFQLDAENKSMNEWIFKLSQSRNRSMATIDFAFSGPDLSMKCTVEAVNHLMRVFGTGYIVADQDSALSPPVYFRVKPRAIHENTAISFDVDSDPMIVRSDEAEGLFWKADWKKAAENVH